MIRAILDCDPGHDDAVAIVLAARHLDLVGITTVGGNAGLEKTTRNTIVVCDLIGRTDIPVRTGRGASAAAATAHRNAHPRRERSGGCRSAGPLPEGNEQRRRRLHRRLRPRRGQLRRTLVARRHWSDDERRARAPRHAGPRGSHRRHLVHGRRDRLRQPHPCGGVQHLVRPRSRGDRRRCRRAVDHVRARRDPSVPGVAVAHRCTAAPTAPGRARCSPTCSRNSATSTASCGPASTGRRCTTHSPCSRSRHPELLQMEPAHLEIETGGVHTRHDRGGSQGPRDTTLPADPKSSPLWMLMPPSP